MKYFISYARRDQAVALEINELITSLGREPWLDVDINRPGSDFWSKICERIRSCDVFIFVVSKSYSTSQFCRIELEYAQACKRYLFPIVTDPRSFTQLNLEYGTMHACSYYEKDDKQRILGFYKNISEINEDEIERLPSNLPPEPEQPYHHLYTLFQTVRESKSYTEREEENLLNDFISYCDDPEESDYVHLESLSRQFLRQNLSPHIAKETRARHKWLRNKIKEKEPFILRFKVTILLIILISIFSMTLCCNDNFRELIEKYF